MKPSFHTYLTLYVALSKLATCNPFPSSGYPTPEIPVFPYPPTPKHRHEHRLRDDELYKYPNITLDHGIHLPTYDDEEAGYVLYSNVRYGQNPTGDLRWALPVGPEKVESDLPVFDGLEGNSCYQAAPQWAIDAHKTHDPSYNWTEVFGTETDGEDCLFLDVATPLEVVENEQYPVVVWFYCGAFAYGKKDMPVYSPAGLYRRANGDKFIYVAFNYRMGAFGFLSGPASVAEGNTPNLGLHDQRLALKWVQDNISKFGGNPNQVTIMGESAGAGSIVHHLVWNGEDGDETVPFKKAVLQSPDWVPVPGSPTGFSYQDDLYELFLNILGADDLSHAKHFDVEDIVKAGRELIRIAPYGTFNVGPVVDGTFIQAHPLVLLAEQTEKPAVEILTTIVGAEGLPFVPRKFIPPPDKPWEWLSWRDRSDQFLKDFINSALPLLDPEIPSVLLDLYPRDDPRYSSSDGEFISISSQTQRLSDILGQGLVQCTVRSLSTTFGGETYNYMWSQLDKSFPNNYLHIPLRHGADVPYTFYDIPIHADPKLNTSIATQWQKYVLGFALESNPNYFDPAVNVTKYGNETNMLKFDCKDEAKIVEDPYSGWLCDEFWPRLWKFYGEWEENDGDGSGVVREGKERTGAKGVGKWSGDGDGEDGKQGVLGGKLELRRGLLPWR